MLALAERLPRDVFAIDFLVLSGTGEYDARARAAGARIRYVGSAPPPGASLPSRVVRRVAKTARFIRTTRAGRYDIVDAWLYPSDVLAAIARPLTGAPIVVSGRRNLDPHEGFGPAGPAVDAVAMRLTDIVVANSAAAAAYAIEHERLHPAKVRIIRNGVEPIDPMRPDERATRRRELGFGADQTVIGCLANYLPVKRHELLIDAFASVVRSRPDARLVLVGEGPMREAIERRIRSHGLDELVRLHGSVEDPTGLLGAFDLMVQASRSEGLPNALLESAAAGRAIVATAAGGSDEVVVDGESGLLVPVDDVEALSIAMGHLLGDPELRARLGAAARERTSALFGMDRFVAEFGALYLELARARHASG
jgi:glycosyltransferase involved in cell wall biosynthesis